MVATVLIGKAPSGQGVSAHVSYLGDEHDLAFGQRAATSKVRSMINGPWAHLDGPVTPSSHLAPDAPGEMVFKIARFKGHNDQVWTWIGCYAAARFAGNQRDGTYIGAGVLDLDSRLPARKALEYITALVEQIQRLMNQGVLRHTVTNMISAGVEVRAHPVVASPPRTAHGLAPRGARRLCIDLSDVYEKIHYDDCLTQLVDEAQDGEEFDEIRELILTNSPDIANRAAQSRGYDVVTPSEWEARRAPPYRHDNQEPPQPPREFVASTTSKPVPSTPENAALNGAGAPESALFNTLRRIEEGVNDLSDRHYAGHGKPHPDASLGRWPKWGLPVAATALLALGAYAIWPAAKGLLRAYGDENQSTDLNGSATSTRTNADSTPATSAPSSFPACKPTAMPEAGKFDEDQAKLAETEITCLKAARVSANARIQLLRDAMPSVAAPVPPKPPARPTPVRDPHTQPAKATGKLSSTGKSAKEKAASAKGPQNASATEHAANAKQASSETSVKATSGSKQDAEKTTPPKPEAAPSPEPAPKP